MLLQIDVSWIRIRIRDTRTCDSNYPVGIMNLSTQLVIKESWTMNVACKRLGVSADTPSRFQNPRFQNQARLMQKAWQNWNTECKTSRGIRRHPHSDSRTLDIKYIWYNLIWCKRLGVSADSLVFWRTHENIAFAAAHGCEGVSVHLFYSLLFWLYSY